ncbi:ureidoglycolate lyase [Rhodoferax aquaticus]|uniref:Ureidoglycolate hydrolase n=1 Tax=Rhodoferax aquaticus TaxID=2527691 RepID=A0A515EMY6_9BURK|nr:ureidoglycolate lyase [Rhodoferax aquaticus]QDL53998.1 ureidoglycolate hydrolase [Rhodoferax aquaticus]
MNKPFDYLHPALPVGLKRVRMPVVAATAESLKKYGVLVQDPEAQKIEIKRWPAEGWRPVDEDSGNEAGTTQGEFVSQWRGDILYGRNEAVGGHYVLGYTQMPEKADPNHQRKPTHIMLWHANYHPDGGQLFFPIDKKPFLVPLALPGDDVKPAHFVCFYFDGTQGLYIHPNVWHEGVFGLEGTQRFYDKQGAVHARVSVDFAREFGCLLDATIPTVQ